MCSAFVWPRSVQGHNLRLNIVWLYFVSALYLLNPWWDLQITWHKCQVWWDNVQCLFLTKVVQGQGHNLRLNIVWLYFVSALYLLNPCWDFQITLHKCQVWWDDVQYLCLTKVGSRSRSQFKIKHCMTVFHLPLQKKCDSIQWHTGGDTSAFVSESTRLVTY